MLAIFGGLGGLTRRLLPAFPHQLVLALDVRRPIKVDNNTLDVRRGHFAHVCVEVDLNKSVMDKVWLFGFWDKVKYEVLHDEDQGGKVNFATWGHEMSFLFLLSI